MVGILLAIISILVAVGIYFLQKKRRYPGRLECVILDVRKVVNRMQFIPGDLSLESQGISIDNNLVAVEFAVLNQREFDIVLHDNEFITFRLPEGYSWVSLNVCKCIEAASPQLLKSEERREYRLSISMLKKGGLYCIGRPCRYQGFIELLGF